MSEKPYHRYVFNADAGEFVGKFEEMYDREDVEGYDSWSQEDSRHLSRRLSLVILERHNFDRVLDIGCGKGSFTHLLKKTNNSVVGIDVSPSAISKARTKYRDIDFRTADTRSLLSLASEPFDLVVAMEVLSYVSDWRDVLGAISRVARFLYLTLYLPPDPLGFVKSFDELIAEVSKHFVIETQLLVNNEQILLFAAAAR